MASRSTAGTLQQLIDDVPKLEHLARSIQGPDEATQPVAAETLSEGYRRWFGMAIGTLPEDLRDRFRNEYEGSVWSPRIKHFLQDPLAKSIIYSEEMDAKVKQILKPWQYPSKESFINPLRLQYQLLEEALARQSVGSVTSDAVELLEAVARKLPTALAILELGHREKPGVLIENEYDLQHVFHAICTLHFDEVEPEEQTPKMAGSSSRLDFLLKQERVAVEMKMTRPGLGRKKLRDELAIDIQYFKAHPHVDALFVLAYDPKRKITNPIGFENDLRSDSDGFLVRVAIAA